MVLQGDPVSARMIDSETDPAVRMFSNACLETPQKTFKNVLKRIF